VGVHSFTLSYTLGLHEMWLPGFIIGTHLCFGLEPKARVAITLEVDSKIFDEVFKKLLDVRILLGLASTLMTILPTIKNRN
jgi:hypothetical protein